MDLSPFVRHYDAMFDFGDDIDKIVQSFEFKPTMVGMASHARVDVLVRSAQAIDLTAAARGVASTSIAKRADYRVHQALMEVAKRYRTEFPWFDFTTAHESITLLRYENGQCYKQHVDSGRGIDRTLTVILGLNEGYEGGQLALFDGAMAVRVGKGQALAFPSNFMFPHEVTPVTKGVRYSAVCWF